MEVENVDFVTCPVCGNRYRELVQHLKKHHGISSDDFRRTYPSVPLVCSAAHILNNRKSNSPLVQQRLYQYLSAQTKLNVQAEYRVGSTFADIAFPELSKAIEVDGVYFHTESKQTEQQKRSQRFEELKNATYSALGWSVLHITDKELVEDTCAAIRKVLSFIGRDDIKVQQDITLLPDRHTKCARCGKQLTLNQVYDFKQFCCRECSKLYKKEHLEAAPCTNCGRTPTPLAYDSRRFCCQDCLDKYMSVHAKSITQCKNCGKTLYVTSQQPHVFCNTACAIAFRDKCPEEWRKLKSDTSRNTEYNKKRREEGNVECVCANCGKHIVKHMRDIRRAPSGNLFCNASCYHAFTKGKKRQRVKNESKH